MSKTATYKFRKSQAQRESEKMSSFLRSEAKRIRESGTRVEAIELLHEAGIVDRKGKLKPEYL